MILLMVALTIDFGYRRIADGFAQTIGHITGVSDGPDYIRAILLLFVPTLRLVKGRIAVERVIARLPAFTFPGENVQAGIAV